MSRRLRIAGLVSLALHALLLAGILLAARWQGGDETADTPAAVELVMIEQEGAGQPAAPVDNRAVPDSRTARPAMPQEPTQPVPPPPPPPPQATDATEPEPLPVPPVPPPAEDAASAPPSASGAEAAEPPVSPAPVFNLGGTDSESNAIVLGDSVIPASPDNAARNRPPLYPDEAARRRQRGTVILLIHVSPLGLTAGVDVVQSSGHKLLDEAARDAVMGWRFRPAVKDGTPVPFDMPMRFVFALD